MVLTPLFGSATRSPLPSWPSSVATVEDAAGAVVAMAGAAAALGERYRDLAAILADLDPAPAAAGLEALSLLSYALEDLPGTVDKLLPALAPPAPAHQLVTVVAGAVDPAPVVAPAVVDAPRREYLIDGPLLTDPTVLDGGARPGPSRLGVTESEARLSLLRMMNARGSSKLPGRKILLPVPLPTAALHAAQVTGPQLSIVAVAATTAAEFAADPARPRSGRATRDLQREADAYAALSAAMLAAAPVVLTAQTFAPLAAAQTTIAGAIADHPKTRTPQGKGPSWA